MFQVPEEVRCQDDKDKYKPEMNVYNYLEYTAKTISSLFEIELVKEHFDNNYL